MDFRGQDTIKHEYLIDDITGDLTVTFKTAADAVIGTIEIEGLRYRNLAAALEEVARVIYNDLTPNLVKARTSMDKNALTATTEF